jgi:hypothetical protein
MGDTEILVACRVRRVSNEERLLIGLKGFEGGEDANVNSLELDSNDSYTTL